MQFPLGIEQPVPPQAVMVFWPSYRHLIVAALATSPGVETIQDVERRLASGAYQAFFGQRSIVITEVSHYDRRTALTVIHGGGELGEMLDCLDPIICRHGRRVGADCVMVQGREGWKRAGAGLGYKLGWIVLVKDLPPQAA